MCLLLFTVVSRSECETFTEAELTEKQRKTGGLYLCGERSVNEPVCVSAK